MGLVNLLWIIQLGYVMVMPLVVLLKCGDRPLISKFIHDRPSGSNDRTDIDKQLTTCMHLTIVKVFSIAVHSLA